MSGPDEVPEGVLVDLPAGLYQLPRRADLTRIMSFPVYAIGTAKGPLCWRLLPDDGGTRRLEDVTPSVRAELSKRMEAARERSVKARSDREERLEESKRDVMDEHGRLRAPIVRRLRKEVELTETFEADPGGTAKGIRKADQVQTRLRRYHKRKSLMKRQFDAGERLQSDWIASQEALRLSSDPSRPRAHRPSEPGELDVVISRRAEAAASFQAAIAAVGIRCSAVLVWVVCDDRSAESWAKSRGKGRPDGIALLREALDVLADHYGFGY